MSGFNIYAGSAPQNKAQEESADDLRLRLHDICEKQEKNLLDMTIDKKFIKENNDRLRANLGKLLKKESKIERSDGSVITTIDPSKNCGPPASEARYLMEIAKDAMGDLLDE